MSHLLSHPNAIHHKKLGHKAPLPVRVRQTFEAFPIRDENIAY